MEKPTIISLTKQSFTFVFGNMKIFLNYIKIIFPLAVVLSSAPHIGAEYNLPWLEYIVWIFVFYLSGYFEWHWYRLIILGERAEKVDPYLWSSDKKDFFVVLAGIYLGVILIPLMFMASEILSPLLGMIITIPLAIYILVQIVKVNFLLPAKAIGADVSFSDVNVISYGLKGPFFGAFILTALIIGAVSFAYVYVVEFLTGVVLTSMEEDGQDFGLLPFLYGIPMEFGRFLFLAIIVTALSVAYQWGVVNDPDKDRKRSRGI